MQKTIGTILMVLIGLSFNTNPAVKKNPATFSDRKSVEQINNSKGEVRQIGNEDIYMIWCAEKYLKLNPYNLPEKFRKPGLSITFSGYIKEGSTLEDQWGELFELTSIHE
jgi:hypothetical protein